MGKKIIIVGGFHEIIELCEENNYEILGIIDNFINDYYYLGYKIIGKDEDGVNIFTKYKDIPLVITPDSVDVREKLFTYYSTIGFKFETIISKNAKISKSAIIGNGTIIQSGVNISSCSIIGSFVKVNVGANIMHDCKIGNFVTIAPNAVVLGKIEIGKNSYIGANATILPNISICNHITIGAGAVVTKNIIQNNSTYAGVPAKKIN